ncbi:MAG: glycoside hydrolase family 57 protein [Campylobacterota bacterium]|nr:glycoside hydrolase family 57 protein [Campylobacterota bacterium]
MNLCFFWHMHQPDYRGSDGVMSMPWVFLHAIKDYYEMPWLLSMHKGLKATFNITPPLIEQLNLYDNPLENDYFLSLWAKEPNLLEAKDREWLIKTCKSTQYETMIKPIAYLDKLYHKEHLDEQELIDFEVLFMLAWCGNYLRQENLVVQKLFKKEYGFSQEDKMRLLQSLCEFIKTILPFYAKLQRDGIISLSTTPYNHPILPLLLDMQNAKKANKHTTLPDNPMSLREDAIEQVERSIALYKDTFKTMPTGFWPAEGAVDEESVKIYKELGLSWIATDEAVLFRSLGDKTRSSLYKPYSYNDMTIGFRDHGLSDLIGFNYRFKSGQEASEHFMEIIKPIYEKSKDATLFIILDGENAWEFFKDNAYGFFTELYNRFLETPWCKTVTMDEVSKFKTKGILDNLSSGSWIHGNFDTWSGHREKNRAWELIYQTKRDLQNYSKEISKEVELEIRSHFLASECSDWFWWYGDDHATEFGSEFDALFRGHLISIYHLLNMQPPTDLFVPIFVHKSSISFLTKPQSPITPLIDGKNSSFFEWLGSGIVDESKLYSTMDRVRGPIEKIHYGYDDKHIYLAFVGRVSSLEISKLNLKIIIEETGEQLDFFMGKPFVDKKVSLAICDRVELSISKAYFKKLSRVHLRFEILQGSEIIQTMPGYGALRLDLDESYTQNWFI